MAGLLERLSAGGYKLTPQRMAILRVLEHSDQHLTAEEVADQLAGQGRGVSVATIYRNLNLLVDLGLASKLELHDRPARFELNRGHNHHLVCLGCGSVIKLDLCPMQGLIDDIIREQEFLVCQHHFEITGYCRTCRKVGREYDKQR